MPRWRRTTAPLYCRPGHTLAAVLVVERWILARLRHRRFYSLAERNTAISELPQRLNEQRPIRRLGLTRRQLLEQLDRPALKPLPTEPYVFAQWRVRRVGIDYHVDVEGHFYSDDHAPPRHPRIERPRRQCKNCQPARHRTPGDIMSEHRATSSRNARATSSESAGVSPRSRAVLRARDFVRRTV
jgi:hypothetical protein